MIPVRIKRSILSKPETYYLPSGYGDLTLKQYLGYHAHVGKASDLVAYLLNCSPDPKLISLAPHLYWLEEAIDVEEFRAYVPCVDIRSKTLGQKMLFHDALKANPTMSGIANAVKIYYPTINPEARPLSYVMPLYLELERQLKQVLTIENQMLSKPPTAEQIRAGVEEFNSLGYFNQVDDLATSLGLTYDEVTSLEYNIAFAKLLKNKISATFSERYSAIMRESKH